MPWQRSRSAELLEAIIDGGESAKSLNRPGLQRLIVNIFTRLNTVGLTLTREDIAFAWLKIGRKLRARCLDRSSVPNDPASIPNPVLTGRANPLPIADLSGTATCVVSRVPNRSASPHGCGLTGPNRPLSAH